MTRAATRENEEALLNVALHGTAMHVETQVRLYRSKSGDIHDFAHFIRNSRSSSI